MQQGRVQLSAALLAALIPVTTLAQPIEVYSCDDCNLRQAGKIARQYPPKLRCTQAPNAGRQLPSEPTRRVCTSEIKPLIVANPLTQTAYKFIVKAYNDADTPQVLVEEISLTDPEKALLNRFYALDSAIRPAIDILGKQELVPELRLPYSGVIGRCDHHPSAYLASPELQAQTHSKFTRVIKRNLKASEWNQYISADEDSSQGLEILGEGIRLKVSTQHNQRGGFMAQVYGDSMDNVLVFKVGYNGVLAGNSANAINLSYEILKGASYVDGLTLSLMLAQKPQALKDPKTSDCLRAYLLETMAPQ